MIFVALTDAGILTQPIEAASFAEAGAQLKQLYGLGTGQIRIGVLLPGVTGLLTQHPTDAAQSTLTMSGDSQNQQTIRNNLATFLGVQSPTNAQVIAAVRALARLATADFTGTT